MVLIVLNDIIMIEHTNKPKQVAEFNRRDVIPLWKTQMEWQALSFTKTQLFFEKRTQLEANLGKEIAG